MSLGSSSERRFGIYTIVAMGRSGATNALGMKVS